MGTELANKRLLIMGGNDSIDQISSFAKNNGVVLVSGGIDKDSNLHKISDEQYECNFIDHDVMKKFLVDKKIDGVFSCTSELIVPNSLQYVNELGLPGYATVDQWNILMNKNNMKLACVKYGIDVIPTYNLNNLSEVEYPVIVKPASNCGSIGITVCNNKAEIEEAIVHAKENCKNGEILIEKYINAPFWFMEVHIQNGVPHFCLSKERIFYPSIEGKPSQPFADIYPSRHDTKIKREIFPKFSKMLVDIGIKNASIWVQGFIDKVHIFPFDVGFRLGGGMDFRHSEIEKGISSLHSHLCYALTGNWPGDYSQCDLPFEHQYATISIGLKNGKIKTIKGIESIENMPNVYKVVQYYHEGDEVTKSGLFAQTLIKVFLKNTEGNLDNLINQLFEKIDVIDCYGNDMVLPIDKLYRNCDLELN